MARLTARPGRVLLGLSLIAALLIWTTAPALLDRLPGRLRHYLPQAAVSLITTPLPTSLPAPTVQPVALQATLAVLLPPTPAVTPRPTAAAPVEAGVAQPTPTLRPSATPPSVPPQVRLDDLPIVPQKFNNCGPTNLAIVLNYHDRALDQFAVAATVRPNYEDRNVSPEELRDFARAQPGLTADVFRGGDVATLKRLIAAGLPVIVEKGLEPDAETGWMGHYLTLYGYDDFSSHFLSRDTYLGPWEGDGRQSYADLQRHWEPFNYAFVVVYPAERATEIASLVGPALADERLQWEAAAARARTTLATRPDSAFAWFNLGSSLVEQAKLGEPELWEGAAAAFDQARLLGLPPRMLWYQFGPYEAYLAVGRHSDVRALAETTLDNQGGRNVEETYLYLGKALQAQGDAAGAAVAWRRVVELHGAGPAGVAAAALLAGDS